MLEVAVVSGKGGTGKTTIAGALAHLMPTYVKVDADVDAANFHLLFPSTTVEEEPFYGAKVATIDEDRCVACGHCHTVCRFAAIEKKDHHYRVNPHLCEGCNACVVACPQGAIALSVEETARCQTGHYPKGAPLVGADMEIGAEGSGKLVARLREMARSQPGSGILTDASPGVACTVMSAITGVDFALIVTEPTISGERDFMRVLEVVRHFKINVGLIVNKFDLNPTQSDRIVQKARESSVMVLGKIPYDPMVPRAINQRQSVITFAPESAASIQLKESASALHEILEKTRAHKSPFLMHRP